MASTLIVIGHDTSNRLDLDQKIVQQSSGFLRADCSPGCRRSVALTTGRGILAANYGMPILAFSDDERLKPAELYVIQFQESADAMAFIAQVPAFLNTQHRTLLLVEEEPASTVQEPWTMVIVGTNRAERLLLDTSNLRVLSQCSNCQRTKAVVAGTNASGAASWLLTQSAPLHPAETYVLGFASEADALQFVRANLPADGLHGRTVLLLKPEEAS
jgi:hypothetical protein